MVDLQMPTCKVLRPSISGFGPGSGSRVVINADDFGLSVDVDSTIIRFAESGAISSASLMAVGNGFDRAAAWAAAHQDKFPVGVHLCLSDKLRPLTLAHGLIDSNGCFCSLRYLVRRTFCRALSLDAIREEWMMQIDRVRSRGISPTHLDSHQHVHILPGIADLVVEIAAAEGLAVRHTSGPFGFSFSQCAGCTDYWGAYCRPGVWKSAVVRRLGASLKRRLITAGVPTIDSYISPSSLCGRMRQGASPEAVAVLARLSAKLGGIVEWVVHPSDAPDKTNEPAWMSRMRACDNDMLESRAHLELLKSAGVTVGSYADIIAAKHESELSGEPSQ